MKTTGGFLARRLDPTKRYGLRVTLFAVAVILVLGPFGILVREVTGGGSLTELDLSAAEGLHDEVVESEELVIVLEGISFIGSPLWFYVLLGGVIIYLWIKRRRRL
ncbi:MAG: hypothetical protein M3214_04450, partial [Actinomycetota bacterium]|nr:hypothetical protein [Actinomycetota bacterium]